MRERMKMETKLLVMCVLGMFPIPSNAQESRIRASRVDPLYCYMDIIRGYDSTCVDRVRVTFQNSDEMRIRNIKFELSILDMAGDEPLTLYKAKHDVSMQMNIGEAYTVDLPLVNPISPPADETSFRNKKSWKWEVTIISVNRDP